MEASVAETAGKAGVISIGAECPELEVSGSFDFDFGEDVNAAIEKFGPKVVHTGFIRANIVTAQSAFRSKMRGPKNKPEQRMSPEDAAAWMQENWKPELQSTRGVKKSAEDKYFEEVKNMSPEARKEAMQKLRDLIKAAG